MINNKDVIEKLKEMAELAWASYGYFHLTNKEHKHNDKDKKRLEYFPKLLEYLGEKERDLTPTDILDMTYKYYLDDNGKPKDSFFDDKLFNGDMSPNQAKRFFERYELLFHQPNTNSGFSATLFKDKGELDKVTGKRKSVDSNEQYILSIRGSEMSDKLKEVFNDFYADFLLVTNKIPKQYFDLIDFIETKIKPRIYNKISQSYSKITIVGICTE